MYTVHKFLVNKRESLFFSISFLYPFSSWNIGAIQEIQFAAFFARNAKISSIRYFFLLWCTAWDIKTALLASKLCRELQQRVFVGFWIGTRRWKALTPNFKMVRAKKYVRTSGTLWWVHNRHKNRFFCMMCLLCATCVQITLRPMFESDSKSTDNFLSNEPPSVKIGHS